MKTIKSERIRLGLTQHQFADLIGVPFRTIQNWETGQRKCPDYVVKLILDKLEDKECICPNCGTKISIKKEG